LISVGSLRYQSSQRIFTGALAAAPVPYSYRNLVLRASRLAIWRPMVWVEFAICAALVIWASTILARYGDVLAEKTGLGGAWVGGILLAGVTSLPELVSGVAAVSWLQQPNLAAGGVLGSCLFNLVLIAVLDFTYQPGSILARAHNGHVLSSALGILLLGIVAGSALLGPAADGFGLMGFSAISLIILIVYVLGARLISRFEQRRMAEVLEMTSKVRNYDQVSAVRAYGIFLGSAIAVVALGVWLASLGDRIAATTGLSHSFVGTLFLAVSTSLPEIAAGIAAVRLGAIDMAISNVLGSNLFNIMLFPIFDMADGSANFWSSISPANAFSAVVAMIMTGIAIVSLTYRASPDTPKRFTWDALALTVLYFGALIVVYVL
jgi:cation:H+ antiporter